MGKLVPRILFFILVISTGFEKNIIAEEYSDTSAINKQTKEALLNSRRAPEAAIGLAHKALSESTRKNYAKGMADSYLALGTAFLTKYNPGDSARYYCFEAFNLYNELNNEAGIAQACYALAYVYSFKGDIPESEKYASLSLSYFEKIGNKRGMVNSFSALSYLAKQRKDFNQARDFIQKAIETATLVKDTLPLADAKNSLGNIYKDMVLFKQAIDAYFEALNLWELKGDSNGISIAYGSIGLMYYYQKEWDKALEFNRKKLPISLVAGNLWEASKTYNTIAQIYNSQHKYDTALFFLRKGLNLDNQMNYPAGMASTCNNIASVLLMLSKSDSALWYAKQSVTIAAKTGDKEIATYYITLGNVMQKSNFDEEALQNVEKAYDLAKKQKLPLTRSDASMLLSIIYNKTKRHDLAYKFLREYMQLRDSISSDENRMQVTRMEIQYDFDKKQKAAEYARMEEKMIQENRIRQSRIIMSGLIVLLVFVALVSFLVLRHNRLRSRYTRMDLEQRLLRAQMNPHFIFNSLSAVQDFILAGKPKNASNYLTKIARLMRNILENSREEFIPLEKEIETVKLYLDLQKLRFENEFEYKVSCDAEIDPQNFSIPPMLTQPCVENSVEHGLLHKKEKGLLTVTYSLDKSLMRLEVTDNGLGRNGPDTVIQKTKKSVSTQITTERLENFRKKLRQKNISYEITDLFDHDIAAGTKVVMMLPYRKIFA